MSDFIELTYFYGKRRFKFNAKNHIFYIDSVDVDHRSRTDIGLSASGDEISVGESPEEILAKIQECNKKQKVYDCCLKGGNGAIPRAIPRYANCLGCGMVRDLNVAQQKPCGCAK